jgi:hypothetical protein
MKTKDKIFLIILMVLVVLFITLNPFSKPQVHNADEKIDSLITEIKHESIKIEALNLKITQVQDSLLSIDSLLQENQKKLINLRKQYEKNIFIINKFNSSNIASYFTNRYNNK